MPPMPAVALCPLAVGLQRVQPLGASARGESSRRTPVLEVPPMPTGQLLFPHLLTEGGDQALQVPLLAQEVLLLITLLLALHLQLAKLQPSQRET